MADGQWADRSREFKTTTAGVGRPPGAGNLTQRARAYEMFLAGLKKSDIARELGTTKSTVGNWARKDAWESRQADLVAASNGAAEFGTGDAVAKTLFHLKRQLASRIRELELLCGPINHPTVRLRAIQLWMKLAGVDKAMPDPIDPKSANDLELIEDLVSPESKEIPSVG